MGREGGGGEADKGGGKEGDQEEGGDDLLDAGSAWLTRDTGEEAAVPRGNLADDLARAIPPASAQRAPPRDGSFKLDELSMGTVSMREQEGATLALMFGGKAGRVSARIVAEIRNEGKIGEAAEGSRRRVTVPMGLLNR